MERIYFALLAVVIVLVGMIGVVTMQLVGALIVIALILGILLLVRYFDTHTTRSENETEEEAIVAAALIALVGIAVSQWIVWAAIIGILLITRQSVARIEKRLDAMENR